jgi:NADPH2:quinone reductase
VRVARIDRVGGPEVLVPATAPDPVAGPGEVVVDVHWAGVTFADTRLRAGAPGPFAGTPPLVPGNGVAGAVAEVGAGVDPALAGTRVVTATGGAGGYAERVAVPAEGLVPVPDGLGLDAAAALLADGRTALLLARAAGVRAGERVLVEAAAGGLGTVLVQVARDAGARVVAAAGGADKLALARSLGAEEAVDYRRPGWAGEVGPVDVAFDGVGGAVGRDAFGLVAPGGRMVTYGAASGEWATPSPEQAARRGVTLVAPGRPAPVALAALTAEALAMAVAGRIRPVIGARVPLERAADAHAALEARATMGKTLLDVRAAA